MLSSQSLLKDWKLRGIVMIDIQEYDIFIKNKSTLKETSKDDVDKKDIKYMTNSELEVIDFDGVKDYYIKDLNLKNTPRSNDALLIKDNELYFIEFKNGKIGKKELNNVKYKIYDSLLIFTDIINKCVDYTRRNLNYILVYNKDYRPNPLGKLDKGEVQESREYDKIWGSLNQFANRDPDPFKIGKQFEGLFFKKVYTCTEEEFEEKFIINKNEKFIKNTKVIGQASDNIVKKKELELN